MGVVGAIDWRGLVDHAERHANWIAVPPLETCRTVLKPLDCQAQRDALLQCYTSAPEVRCMRLLAPFLWCTARLHARVPACPPRCCTHHGHAGCATVQSPS